MNKFHKALASVGTTLMVLTVPAISMAQGTTNPFQRGLNDVNTVGQKAQLGEAKPLPVIVGQIINVALGFIGILLLFYLLYAGFLWMTSGGEDDKVGEAKTMIKNAIVGLIIIIAAFSISNFVLNSLYNVTTQT